jgi:hypothetical protein
MVVRDVQPTGEMDAIDAELAFQSTVIHELAHIVARYKLFAERDENDRQSIAAEAAAIGARAAGPRPLEYRMIPFFGHGATFIRTTLHLCYRADQVGTPGSPLVAGPGYLLSRKQLYRAALADEPQRMINARFIEIVSAPYPEAFWRLWVDDVAHWLSHCDPDFERSFG